MGVEEQKEEREVLDSIFPEEITGTSRFSTRSFPSGIIVIHGPLLDNLVPFVGHILTTRPGILGAILHTW